MKNNKEIIGLIGFMDIPQNYMWGFQDPATPAAIALQDLHWYIMTILTDIFIFIIILFIITLYFFTGRREIYSLGGGLIGKEIKIEHIPFNESLMFELIVTGGTALILLFIGIPGLAVLYSLEEALTPILNIKIIGKQWQWSYEYSDYTDLETGETIGFDSAPIFASDDIESPVYNLLSIDNSLILPVNIPVNIIVTSIDIIHSWTIPSGGFKMDAVPGRLNSFTTIFNREGTFYGQCSELCGQGHSMMPIAIKIIPYSDYKRFIRNLME